MNKEEEKREEICIKIIYWSFLSQLLFSVSRRLLSFMPNSVIICAVVSFAMLVVLFLKLLHIKKLSFNKYFLLSVLLATILYLISLISGTPFDKILLYYPQTIYGLSLLFIALSIKDYANLYDYFSRYSFVISIFSIFIIFVDRGTFVYNMHYSYIVLIALCFHTLNLFNDKKKIDFFYLLLDIVLILLFGSRGPILCYSFFLIMYVLFGNQKGYLKALFITMITIVSFNVERVLSTISDITSLFGVRSRTISLLISNPQHVSGRDIILQDTLALIKKNPVIGYGIAGEYKYLKDYPHNLFLDVIVHWGIVLGSLLIAGMLYIIIKGLLYSKDKTRLLVLIFISYGLVMLFFSGTYISFDGFYILMGLSFGVIGNRNRRKNEKQ
ncbi:O-antigen ligase family protein [Candidatus Saccharibacteria bacterium]|nr:O-antigen ligase family protein [Candidatus Saccharibacteria bacterium]